ncbi:hypothetical protein GE21DRAFT_4255 [Neurospora crassa]|uniref:Uncharacterized protein n=1 Tax=Neurospora crassa (strain ATCC 24698 / 74-OR23-1A / CBS 708.71 / DSM 1257 / FGSC 987) TaxID=367110 RepID=A7UWQ8_NEUCR|nr:hypothetical protein NCU10274 [Neurospora crassa OR74A]EDO65117.1 hypothetical protein NCU10274 [Neurospora crassa OR74A]KHE84304.1 hypothetical protein GE21DRAFT_4255 [Neurospora crassa]|eukprot:XP_001728208.1 hypothetical protein NCU10274 [Neurospora crassa OR74A]
MPGLPLLPLSLHNGNPRGNGHSGTACTCTRRRIAWTPRFPRRVRRVRPCNPDLPLGVQSRAALLVGHGVRRFDSCNISPQGMAIPANHSPTLVGLLARYASVSKVITHLLLPVIRFLQASSSPWRAAGVLYPIGDFGDVQCCVLPTRHHMCTLAK